MLSFRDYIHFLKVEKNLSENTLIRYMKVIKKITNMALANEWMTKNPFVNIKFHEQEVQRTVDGLLRQVPQ